jgi:hypothetical protein
MAIELTLSLERRHSYGKNQNRENHIMRTDELTVWNLLRSSLAHAKPRRPSPILRRAGFRIVLFDACSTFTRVTAWMLAEQP